MTTTDYILSVITLLGGLALFLFGMDIMGKALHESTNDVVKELIRRNKERKNDSFLKRMVNKLFKD